MNDRDIENMGDVVRQLVQLFLKQQQHMLEIAQSVTSVKLFLAERFGIEPIELLRYFQEIDRRVQDNPITSEARQQLQSMLAVLETGNNLKNTNS